MNKIYQSTMSLVNTFTNWVVFNIQDTWIDKWVTLVLFGTELRRKNWMDFHVYKTDFNPYPMTRVPIGNGKNERNYEWITNNEYPVDSLHVFIESYKQKEVLYNYQLIFDSMESQNNENWEGPLESAFLASNFNQKSKLAQCIANEDEFNQRVLDAVQSRMVDTHNFEGTDCLWSALEVLRDVDPEGCSSIFQIMSKITICHRFYNIMSIGNPSNKKFFSRMLRDINVQSIRMMLEGNGKYIRGPDSQMFKRLLKALYCSRLLSKKHDAYSAEKRNQFVLFWLIEISAVSFVSGLALLAWLNSH